MSPGNANAHFSFSRGTSAAESPAARASWKRVLAVFTPHPFQRGPVEASNAAAARHIAAGAGVVTNGVESDLPETNSAIARRSGAVRLVTIEIMVPVSMVASTRSAGIVRIASSCGARLTPASWQVEQWRLYRSAPSTLCACATVGASTASATIRRRVGPVGHVGWRIAPEYKEKEPGSLDDFRAL